jgi:hypothetical protein
MNIDTLVKSFYSDKDETESLINEVLSFLVGETKPVITEQTEGDRSLTIDLIPSPPVSELGWGALKTPEEGGTPVDPKSRRALAQYLKNIPGVDIKAKLAELNKAMDTEYKPTGKTAAEQLQQIISYLVFYKTLTQVITNFNASAAGFAFESFLAVLLDAKGGKQVPASAGATIADIVLTSKDNLPISLKLYKEGQLKVGGSYKQLVDDLTGEYPLMQYIAVTKDISGEGPTAQGLLNFYGFNFTKDNFLEILAKRAKELNLMQIPGMFFKPVEELEDELKQGGLQQLLAIPGRSEVNVQPIAEDYLNRTIASVESAFGKDIAEQYKEAFDAYVDVNTGDYKLTKGQFSATPAFKGSANLVKQIELEKSQRSQLLQLLRNEYEKSRKARSKKAKGGSARRDKIKDLGYRSPRTSYKRLLKLQKEASPELFEAAMKSTIGYITNKQFELSKGDLLKMGEIENKDNLYPYGTFELGNLRVGSQNIQNILDNSVNEFNEKVFTIFNDLKTLSSSLNGYVSGGLQDDNLADTAKSSAEDIASGTEEVASTKDTDSRDPAAGLGGAKQWEE